MSATIFLAICILGCDCLLYFLYQWTYGEKRRGLLRGSHARKSAVTEQSGQPFMVFSRKSRPEEKREPLSVRDRAPRKRSGVYKPFPEKRAYRRIMASFAHAKR
jgi:hypothetical protein